MINTNKNWANMKKNKSNLENQVKVINKSKYSRIHATFDLIFTDQLWLLAGESHLYCVLGITGCRHLIDIMCLSEVRLHDTKHT